MTAAGHEARPRRGRPALVLALCVLGGCGNDPASSHPPCEDVPAVAVGEGLDGTLSAGDRRFDGVFIDYYGLPLAAAADVVIRLSSTDLDPVLFLFDENGEVIAQAFDPEGTPPGELETARIFYEFTPGCHLIGASAFTRDTTGSYTLRLDEVQSNSVGPTD